jgi:hypothetical protein
MDPIGLASMAVAFVSNAAIVTAGAVAKALVAALWKAYKSKIVLGAAIFGFSASGLAMIIWSHTVTGWNQIALLGFGTSFLIVGTVELGILGVLKQIIEPDHTGGLIKRLGDDLEKRFNVLENLLGTQAIQRANSDGLQESRQEVQ